jgi:hypothetical protein
MISKIFIDPESWAHTVEASSHDRQDDFRILRWADSNSIYSRVCTCKRFIESVPSRHHVDFGSGLGHLLDALGNLNMTLLQGVEVNESFFKIGSRRLSNKSSLILHNKAIRDSLSGVALYSEIRPMSVSLIGVLQNCQEDPFDLIQEILERLGPEYLFITTKCSSNLQVINNFDPCNEGHSLLYLPELLDSLMKAGYHPLYISNPENSMFRGTNYALGLVRTS